MRRYRAMNEQEYEKYADKVKQTGGFDVDGCDGCLSGGIVPINPSSLEWEIAARVALLVTQRDNSIVYRQLVKANLQPVRGTMYYLTFTGVDNRDNIEKVYRAKVWDRPFEGIEVKTCTEFINDQNAAVQMREDIVAFLETVPPRPEVPNSSSQKEPYSGEDNVVVEASQQELNIIAFGFLVKELRSQHTNWKYSRVQKAASKKWKTLSVEEKVPYTLQAMTRLEDLQYARWDASESVFQANKNEISHDD